MVSIGAIIFVNRRGNRVCGAYTSSLLALTVQHVLECIVMDGITKLSDSFTTFDTIKPIYIILFRCIANYRFSVSYLLLHSLEFEINSCLITIMTWKFECLMQYLRVELHIIAKGCCMLQGRLTHSYA